MDVRSASRERLRSKNEGGVGGIKAERGDSDVSSEKFTSGLGSGKAAKTDGAGMPKQADYDTPALWSEAVRKWRAQKRALGGM